VADPAPDDGTGERARQDGVDLADAAGGQGPAVLAAMAAQAGVEGVQGGGVQLADLSRPRLGRIERSM
jgi:hypothetical protein